MCHFLTERKMGPTCKRQSPITKLTIKGACLAPCHPARHALAGFLPPGQARPSQPLATRPGKPWPTPFLPGQAGPVQSPATQPCRSLVGPLPPCQGGLGRSLGTRSVRFLATPCHPVKQALADHLPPSQFGTLSLADHLPCDQAGRGRSLATQPGRLWPGP